MKLIIDVDEKTYNRAKNEPPIICGMNDELIYQSNMKEAIANGTPYNPQGDLISREALKNVILNDSKLDGANANWEVNRILVHIDNAPTVSLPNEQIAWEQGYEYGYHQAKEDAIRRIAEQYSAHSELIPKWLSIGDMKGGKKE